MIEHPLGGYVLRYFGEVWNSPMITETETEQVDVPLGQSCILCSVDFQAGDRGYFYASGQPVHRECGFRAVVGGVNHLKGTCTCKGGSDPPDPPDLTRREAGLASWAWAEEHGL